MDKHKKTINRIYLNKELSLNVNIKLDEYQYNYLIKVLRYKIGSLIKVFNEKNGEWLSEIVNLEKKSLTIKLIEFLRIKEVTSPKPILIFAPVKNPNPNFYIQKATELGVGKIIPLITKRTILRSLNLNKLKQVATEATEQSERLCIPDITQPITLENLKNISISGRIFFCDEHEKDNNYLNFLKDYKFTQDAILIGPEGGFTPDERQLICSLPNVIAVSLGKEILRAETAMIATLMVYKLASIDQK